MVSQFHFRIPPWAPDLGGCVAALALTCSGWRVWRKQGGFYSYFDSGLMQSIADSGAGFLAFGDKADQVSGLTYVLGQIFLAGPLLALRAARHFRNRIENEPGLEERLVTVLASLRQLTQWSGLNQFPQERREILLLAQMREIDFSAVRGEPRFRAYSHGT